MFISQGSIQLIDDAQDQGVGATGPLSLDPTPGAEAEASPDSLRNPELCSWSLRNPKFL